MTEEAPGRIRLVVLFGGRSAEHEVSCVTAVSVLRAVDPRRYDVVPVGITRDGRWVLAEEAAKVLAEGGPAALPPAVEARGPEVDAFEALAGLRGPNAVPAESSVVVFPLLHGPFGEDGTVQGLCELAGVPYVGSGVLGSAACIDKDATKRLLVAAGLPVAAWLALREWDVDDSLEDRVGAQLGWPVFVKPAALGSSVGVAKVADAAGLRPAVATAFSYGEWVVVEEAVVGREIECGVLGDHPPEASVPGEIRPSREFYDYEDKYVEGKAELLVPAPLPDHVASEVRRLAVAAFAAVRAEAMARVDFFWEEGGRGLLVNEVNTIPGFTPISMYPMLWEASGVPYPELVDRLVSLALERHRRRAGRVGRERV
ncbi:MAG TPA: D-alanine--D-alanine ligase family protein [Acidimicrobiales bacterium]|nr:D-alanine--D-alanine ligase family protein [Acidimicrobiales bacterium]